MTTKGKASMITVTAEQRVLPGKEAKLDALMAGLMENIAQHEPGCTRFDYVVDETDPLRRMCIEPWSATSNEETTAPNVQPSCTM